MPFFTTNKLYHQDPNGREQEGSPPSATGQEMRSPTMMDGIIATAAGHASRFVDENLVIRAGVNKKRRPQSIPWPSFRF
jgi:hypothetical protein